MTFVPATIRSDSSLHPAPAPFGVQEQRASGSPPPALLDYVDLLRLDASRQLDPRQQSALGQFLTPAPVARLMASLFQASERELRILDAGAGVGSLSAALVAELCGRRESPAAI